MVYGDSQLLRKQAFHTEPEKDPFARDVDVNDPLYCKACEKLFARDTVFKAHLLGKKHILALKKKGRIREAMSLESKASMKNKLELKTKRKREGEDPPAAAKAPKAAPAEAEDEGPGYQPNYSSLAACITSCREEEEEQDRVKEAAKVAAKKAAQADAVRYARNVKDDGLGPKAMPENPMKAEPAKDWWKGTAHAQGPQAHTFDEDTRGMWTCLSQKCNAQENPRLYTTCKRCGAQRRIGQEGKQPQLKNTSGDYAKREFYLGNKKS